MSAAASFLSSSSPGGPGGGAAGDTATRGFVAFYRNLLASSSSKTREGERKIRLFARDQGGYYTCHGSDAEEVARDYYSTESVIRLLAGSLPSCSISKNLLINRILPSLLANNTIIEIYEQPAEGGRGEQWILTKTGSPGNTQALEELMLEGNRGGGAGLEDELLGTGAMMALQAKGGLGRSITLGIAVINCSFRTIGLCELVEDSIDLKGLESLIVQVGARECLLTEEGTEEHLMHAIKDAMARCQVLCTRKSKESFKQYKEEKVQEILAGLVQANKLGYALLSLGSLIHHLGISTSSFSTDNDGAELHDLTLLTLKENLQYDSSAAKAMSVFPETKEEICRPGVDSTTEEKQQPKGGGREGKEGAGSSTSTSSRRQGHSSLFSILNKTNTPSGARCIKRWLQRPLLKAEEIKKRQAMVQLLVEDQALSSALSENYGGGLTGTGRGSFARGTPDLERTAQRFSSSKARAKVGLRDLLEVYTATLTLARLQKTLGGHLPEGTNVDIDVKLCTPLSKVITSFAKFQALVEEVVDIDRIVQTQGREVSVKPTFDPELIRLRHELEAARRGMEEEGKALANKIKLEAAKVKLEYSTVHQHHFRLTKKDQAVLKKASNTVVRWQTLSVQRTGLLFTTPDLRKLSQKWENLTNEYRTVQDEIVAQAVDVAKTFVRVMQEGGKLLAELDALLSLAKVASTLNWTCPTLIETEQPEAAEGDGGREKEGEKGPILRIQQLRHPIVEASLSSSSSYIPNDVNLPSMTIVTGPNCGGKSTYIRSVGVAVLLAQIGSFVPAQSMEWSPVDRILCRVGASDSQLRGVSTFMAEMLETRSILNAATASSLVIIDELGRGTSTFDGFGIAWAVASRLASQIQCRSLFATHFHELTDLESALPVGRVQNLHFSAQTVGEELVLTYQVEPGPCESSFGVHVARLAKFPPEVIQDAQARVDVLEAEGHSLLSSSNGNSSITKRKVRGEEGEVEGEDFSSSSTNKKVRQGECEEKAENEAEESEKEEEVGKDEEEELKRKLQVLDAFSTLPLEDVPIGEALDLVMQTVSKQ